MKKVDLANIRELRRKSGINQFEFWSRLGITQSGGSRYETGRNIPTPAAMLIWLRESGVIDDKLLETAKRAVAKKKVKAA